MSTELCNPESTKIFGGYFVADGMGENTKNIAPMVGKLRSGDFPNSFPQVQQNMKQVRAKTNNLKKQSIPFTHKEVLMSTDNSSFYDQDRDPSPNPGWS